MRVTVQQLRALITESFYPDEDTAAYHSIANDVSASIARMAQAGLTSREIRDTFEAAITAGFKDLTQRGLNPVKADPDKHGYVDPNATRYRR